VHGLWSEPPLVHASCSGNVAEPTVKCGAADGAECAPLSVAAAAASCTDLSLSLFGAAESLIESGAPIQFFI